MAAQRYEGQKKAKKKRYANIVFWGLMVAVLSGCALFFATSFEEDSKVKMLKISYPREYSQYVEKAAADYNLDPALIYAVIRTESGFDPNAQSEVGACGLMQLMPSSFEWLLEKREMTGMYTSEDLFTPEVCIDFGSYLLRYFYDYFGDETCAIAAYNAGFVVGDWLEIPEYSPDGVTLVDTPYPETSEYIKKVKSAKEMYQSLYY